MDFDDYKFICFGNNINPQVIEACRKFVVIDHAYLFNHGRKSGDKTSSLGYAECADITEQKISLLEVKHVINSSIQDYDKLGRSLEKKNLKKLINNPHKGLLRTVLKSYYLHFYNL